MHRGLVEFSSQLFVLLESSGNKSVLGQKWKLHLSGNGDFSCNHRWPLTLVVSFAAVIREAMTVAPLYETSLLQLCDGW